MSMPPSSDSLIQAAYHYEAHNALAFVDQIKRVVEAQNIAKDADKALVRCTPADAEKAFPGVSYESIAEARDAERTRLFQIGKAMGIDVLLLAEALA